VRRLLPELRKLNRYEARVLTMRDRALREIIPKKVTVCKTNPKLVGKQ
jgi:hypothetical protein